ncbi:glycosyltransferase family 4 protein [Candidatus Nomurabacteria bacterium]|nr:glycosyltransferase family 4 protein [Candidatus Nomurabacteria bacterium]USN94579.1 MAG: glycosyltransferase family 4 protein [Candidatus Nomurabacteria bacterium]
MKVLYLITKSELGGAQSVVFELLSAHKEKGDNVLLVSGQDGWLCDRAREFGFEVEILGGIRRTFNPIVILSVMRSLRKVAKKFSPEIVSCHSSFAGIIGRFSLGLKYSTVFTAHGIAFTGGAPLWRKPIAFIMEWKASFFCKKIIAVSRNDQKLLQKLPLINPGKVELIYNGVEVPSFVEKTQNEIPKLTFVGRLALPKTPEKVIEAVRILEKKYERRVEVEIIGDGPDMEDIKDLVEGMSLSDRVFLLGALDRRSVLQKLTQSSVFVLPTLWEGFPMTILEAMASGTPVIASDVGGIKEAVSSEVGILIPRNADADVWAEAINEILDKDLREMGNKAREVVNSKFSKEIMINKVFEVYSGVL